jgi:hypothetical protein
MGIEISMTSASGSSPGSMFERRHIQEASTLQIDLRLWCFDRIENLRHPFDSCSEIRAKRTRPDGWKVISRDRVGWSPTRTLHPFWVTTRVGGDPPATRKDVEEEPVNLIPSEHEALSSTYADSSTE